MELWNHRPGPDLGWGRRWLTAVTAPQMQMLHSGDTGGAERGNSGPILSVRKPLIMCARRESDTSTLGVQGKGIELSLSHRYAGKPGLRHRNIPDGRAGCSTCSRDKVLVMEKKYLLCSFPQAAHQLNLTFGFCYNVTASEIFHPKSHEKADLA